MVAAAGNTGWDVDTTPLYPAAFDLDNVISVAASQQDDSLVSWSCHGATSVDIAAPGVDILSTWPRYLYAPGYWQMSGTSMAAPHVAGVAALILSVVPGATYPFLRDSILSSAEPVPSLAGKVSSGGRLDAAAALVAVASSSPITALAPVPALRGSTTVASTSGAVDLRWSASDAAAITSYQLQRSTDGGATYVPITLKPATATAWRQKVTVDAPAYSFRVRATDEHGTVSPWGTGAPFRLRYVQESAPSIAYAGAWSNASVSGALGGGVRAASAAGATATVSLGSGTQAFGLVFARTSSSGKAEIWLDGSRRATLDLYRGALQPRWVGFAASLDGSATHSIVIKVLGKRRPASAGTAVLVDAIATLAT
jgi:hypothetical protein